MKPLLLAASLAALAGPAAAALRVVTTTPDLAALAREIGGDRVRVESLASGLQNAHSVDPKPSHIVKTMKADLFLETGLELESAWSATVLRASRNRDVQPGAPGYLDASSAIEPLEVPREVTRAMGDVHPGGNPHYMQDPVRAGKVAALIAERLSALDPEAEAAYRERLAGFERRLSERLAAWKKRLAPYAGTPFVSYHRDWVYFADRFGLEPFGEIEPKPGIPPTAAHTAGLVSRMKAAGVKLVLSVPWYEARTPRSVAESAGAKVVEIALLPGAFPGTDGYFEWMDYNVDALARALEGL